MEVILLQKVENLGGLGDVVNVKPGYARNYLLPKGQALRANEGNKAEFETRRAELEKESIERITSANSRKAAIEELHDINVKVATGAEGKLYGSVGPAEIAKILTDAGIEIEKAEVRMPLGPIRQVGEYEVGLHLHTEVDAAITVTVEADETATA